MVKRVTSPTPSTSRTAIPWEDRETPFEFTSLNGCSGEGFIQRLTNTRKEWGMGWELQIEMGYLERHSHFGLQHGRRSEASNAK